MNSLRLVVNKLIIRFRSSNSVNRGGVFGSLTAVYIVIQVVSGLLLSIYMLLHMDISFIVVENIIEENVRTHYVRFLHANICSVVFIVMLIHLSKGYYIISYMKSNLGKSRTLLLILVMRSAFLGYVIPGRNISLGGATVITNLLSVLPYRDLVLLNVGGGYTINSATLRRMFSLHFLLPLVVIRLVVVHLILLHEYISSSSVRDNISIIIFDVVLMKDLMVGLLVILGLMYIIIAPQYFIDADNGGEANFIVTPDHIKPEWYFLFAYAILRCIPVKGVRVLRLVGSLILVLILRIVNGLNLRLLFLINFWLLTWLRGLEVNEYFTLRSQISSVIYVVTL